uniref:MRH domain-containing protein n=1 Tax=Ciona savignyi TaxID=51511 RepID=H2YHR6_CIOSA
MEYNTTTLCESNSNGTFFYRSSITFECAKTLGSPPVISADSCSVDILWETSLACRESEYDATKEVRCYAYDSNHHKRDLESLIKRVGGHEVTDPTSASSDKFYINVCRDIRSVDGDVEAAHVGHCPRGAAACLVRGGKGYLLGEVVTPLTIGENNRLILTYHGTSRNAPLECSGTPPQVIVNFVCPGTNRGGTRSAEPPILTSSTNCQYSIEWWTEAACVTDFVSSSTCRLDLERHGIDLDLSPLTLEGESSRYTIHTQDSAGTTFYINVCETTGILCGAKDDKTKNTVCQTTSSNPKGYIGGEKEGYKVKYFDGQLSLTYKNGDRCHGNGFRRTSVILFHCNKTAGEFVCVGSPVFSHEIHCTYYFDWETRYACLAPVPSCSVVDEKGQNFDLSPLARTTASHSSNWEVLDGGDATENRRYFVNVCGEIIRDSTTTNCPIDSSVCLVHGGISDSLGSFAHSSITAKDNKILLNYTGGACPSGGVRTTLITLYCRLGDLESSPVLKYHSPDDCVVSMTWHTAAACPLKTVTGTDCIISDEDSGLTFDLRRLTQSENMYKIPVGDYDYYLNICGELKNSPCNKPGNRPAACQVKRTGQHRAFTTGQVSDSLTYYDGFIKLVYHDGDSYSNKLHNRSTQISFLCDNSSGTGRPEFVNEGNFTYLFNWYTSYVCPAASVQCMVTDPSSGQQYDLSSLAKSEDNEDANWSAMGGNDGQPKSKYYLNVCRPVNEIRATNLESCDALAGACSTTVDHNGIEKVEISNLGRPTSGPRIESSGHLSITYTSGGHCVENGVSKNYSTIIHFVCVKGALSSTPRFIERSACSVSFMWNTEAACPITSLTQGSCEVVDPNSRLTYNLRPLTRKPSDPYRVDGVHGYEYELNICGNVETCQNNEYPSSAGCAFTHTTTKLMRGYLTTTVLTYSDDGQLSLTYQSKNRISDGNFLSYVVNFICNHTVSHGAPRLSNVDGDFVRFDFPTSLVCQPEQVDCVVTDDLGNQYDLTPLSNPDHPWDVLDEDNSRRFFLSVCRPLPPVPGCSGGGNGACYTYRDATDNQIKGHGLGLIQSNPIAVREGNSSTVSIRYMGGDVCGHDSTRRYASRIIFECSTAEGKSPVMQPNDESPCDFVFIWETPFACPVSKSVTQNDAVCSVVEPLYHMTFDLSTMTSATDYIFSGVKSCVKRCVIWGKVHSVHLVARKGDSVHTAGNPNTTLVYNDAVIKLTYLHGEKCHQNQFERSTEFRFTCHHHGNENPTFINETHDCTYLFDWPTPHACPPIRIVECTAQGPDGQQYDLSALSLMHANHMTSTSQQGRSYFINVCRTLLHTPGVTCPPNSAACMKTSDNTYTNLGSVHGVPQFVDGKLRISYTDGAQCAGDNSKNYTTTVTFECSRGSGTDTVPVVTSEEAACHVQILWSTSAACPLQRGGTMGSCRARNPATGHVFDLSSLESTSYYAVHSLVGEEFHINVCEHVVDQHCEQNAGSCLHFSGSYITTGEANANLTYTDGVLTLRYDGGHVCSADNRYRHSTVINFVCHRSTSPSLHAPGNPQSTPVHISDDRDTCTHYFSWHTYRACEEQYPCAVNDLSSSGGIIDLSPFVRESGHYPTISNIVGERGTYFINICRPLTPTPGVTCPAGSASCEVIPGQPPKALGYIDPSHHSVSYESSSNTVAVDYHSNLPCTTSSNSSVTVSTRIIFSCLRGAGKGEPRLTAVTEDCVYLFSWPTDLILCDSPSTSPSSGQCSYTNDVKKLTYDLSKLGAVTVAEKSGTFQIDLCQSVVSSGTECEGAAICYEDKNHHKVSLGAASSRTFLAGLTSVYALTARYTNGDTCGNCKYFVLVESLNLLKKFVPALIILKYPSTNLSQLFLFYHVIRPRISTTIFFICDHNPTTPDILYNGDDCHYSVYWKTDIVCPPVSESCVVTDANLGLTFDLSLLSSLTHSWTFRNDGYSYFFNLCQSVHMSGSYQCKVGTAVCRRKGAQVIPLSFGTVVSQSARVISRTNIEIKYTGGEKGVCTDTTTPVSTVISLVCDPAVLGKPRFERCFSKEKCKLRISWKTRIACSDSPTTVMPDRSGKFIDPKSGMTFDLSPLINKRSWVAGGDLRDDTSSYKYMISIHGNPDIGSVDQRFLSKCGRSATVCQYNIGANFVRQIGAFSDTSPSFVISDESLEVNFTSMDRCGKDSNKHSYVVVALQCSADGLGNPEFFYESNDCGYYFRWYTSVMC